MKITLLGTGTPEPNKRRASSGYLVEVGSDKVLFDCGGGVFDRLIQAGFKPSDITHLFFTHLHSDHMMDYARLVHAAWDEGGHPLTVFGPAPIQTITDRFFGKEGAFATDLAARTENEGSQAVWVQRGGTLPRPWPSPQVTEIQPGYSMQHEHWQITSCEVPHAQPWLDCMAYRIETEDASFVYCGDSGYCTALEALAQNADVLLHWLYRLSSETASDFITGKSPAADDIAKMAARANVRQLLFTHLRPHMDTEQHHNDILKSARAHYNGRVSIAEDLDEIMLSLNS